MWHDYLKEIEGIESFITPTGFFTFKTHESKEMVIHDFYIKPMFRGLNQAYRMHEHMLDIAESRDIKSISCFIQKYQNNYKHLPGVYAKVGFKTVDEDDNRIIMLKEL